MSKQLTSSILMIRPVGFKLNKETAVNNYYQHVIDGLTEAHAQEQAVGEFDEFVEKLRSRAINVIVVNDTSESDTPDSIFPNNWLSFHDDGTIVLYPMYAENRRLERRTDIKEILAGNNFLVEQVKDFTSFEASGKYLEGTGSMLLDRDNHIVYAALSERTDKEVLDAFCREFSYKAVSFRAYQTVNNERLPIYHTNVMMCLTDKLAIIGLSSIDDDNEREVLVSTVLSTGKQIIDISEAQIEHFAGNMLGLKNSDDKKFIIMSAAALQSLNQEQIVIIEEHYEIIASSLDTIEALGGGSARCMMAEIFLPKTI